MLSRLFKKPKYNPKEYWSNAGRVQKDEILKIQAKAIMKNIADLHFTTVFELGPGEGRITEPILKNKDIIIYDSIDYTPERIEILKEKLKDYEQFNVKYGDFQSMNLVRKYDLVLASEVLMHIKPDEVYDVMKKMVSISDKYVVNIDYWEDEDIKLANHNFIHNYFELYDKLGIKYKTIQLDYKQTMFIGDING